MNQVFAPGCVLSIYKPELSVWMPDLLNRESGMALNSIEQGMFQYFMP